ncbi:MAG: FHA domain-containing protein [Planctomycetota bacterium]
MAQLFVLSGPDAGRSFELAGPMVLGRGTDCDIRLKDRSISRRHARIEPDLGGWVLVDLGSRNGVRHSGERVERAVLTDMDEIQLGELPLRFRMDADEPLPAAAPAAPAPPPPARPAAPAEPQPEPELGGGFELEEEIDLEDEIELEAPAPKPAPAAAPRRAAPAERPRPEPQPELSERDLERARILAESRSSTFLSGDLSQWPASLRWGTYLLVLAVMVGFFYGAFKLVESMRGSF